MQLTRSRTRQAFVSVPAPFLFAFCRALDAGALEVLSDSYGHAPYIGAMPHRLNVLFTRGSISRTVTIILSGSSPLIDVKGTSTYDEEAGSFTATGSETVTANHIPVNASFSGTLKDGQLSGTRTFSELPTARSAAESKWQSSVQARSGRIDVSSSWAAAGAAYSRAERNL